MSDTIDKRFRIAFSFAGEKRVFVAETAKILADKFGEEKILYDNFHEAEFSNADLAFDLPDFYKNNSDLVVTVFCKNYEKKEWCGLEWRAIFAMIKENRAKDILLGRFDFVSEKGLQGLEGFAELGNKTPEDFANLILERLALNEGNPKNHYTKTTTETRTTTTIPHNLPRLQPFFGREEELKKIAEALDPENRTWGTCIAGDGGMGKTSLAVRAALDVSPEVFDKIVFVSLKSRELDDEGERYLDIVLINGLSELFSELAMELGQDEITKLPEEQRAKLLLQALRDASTLLILDNLESLLKKDRDTIFTFVRRLPTGCKAILTSRERIGSVADEFMLGELSKEAALDTIEELGTHNLAIAKTTEAERIVLYELTGGKPLLLRWTAGQIGRGKCLTMQDAIGHLRSCPKGNDPLEFIFGELIQGIAEDEVKILCAMSHFTLPAKVGHITGLVERTDDEVKVSLHKLANLSLAVSSEDNETYTLIPLVGDFLRKKRPQIINETGNTLEKQVFELVIENAYENFERFPVLDAAWPAIAAALPHFLSGPNERLQQICDALYEFLNFTGRWDERLAVSLDAEKKAEIERDYANAGWRAYDSGCIYYLRNQATEVLEFAERADKHWQKVNSGQREQAYAIRLRGMGHELVENHSAAIKDFKDALCLFKTVNPESEDVARCLNNLACAKIIAGDLDGAEQEYREVLRIAQLTDNKEIIAGTPISLACLALDREQWSEAEELSRETMHLCEQLGRLELIAINCYCLAEALQRQGKKAEGLPYAQRAVEIYSKLSSPNLAIVLETLKACEEEDEE